MPFASRTIAVLVGLLVLAIGPAATAHEPDHSQVLHVEVAEDGTRFVWDEEPRFDNGYPAYGNAFVTQGYIYPAGTLNGTNGVNADGSPEFPDKVIGEWTCWGYFVGDGANTTEGAWVVTTQVFDFDSVVLGYNSIVTVGFEAPADAGMALRSVVGGTGRYASARGEVAQVTLGHNASDGVDARFRFVLEGVERPASAGLWPAVTVDNRHVRII